MGATFKKQTTLSGKFKNLICNGEVFIDEETGEEINLAEILFRIYGTAPFDMSTSYKQDDDIE